MPDDTKTWRWVQGDDKDPAERWLLVEGDGPLPGPRVILECGQVDAADLDLIKSAPQLYRELMAAEKLLGWMDEWGNLGKVALKRLDSIRAVLAAARGEGDPDGQ